LQAWPTIVNELRNPWEHTLSDEQVGEVAYVSLLRYSRFD
jgi:hypothetical protein